MILVTISNGIKRDIGGMKQYKAIQTAAPALPGFVAQW